MMNLEGTPFTEELLLASNFMIIKKVNSSPEAYTGLVRFMFTFGLVDHVKVEYPGSTGSYVSFRGRWCYQSHLDAVIALAKWEGEGDPPGPWIKYKGIGVERHNPKMFTHRRGSFYERNTVDEEDTW